jgi:hypothetical protein
MNPAWESERVGLLRKAGLAIMAIGVAACILGAFLDPAQFFRSYHFAFLTCLQLALGCFALLMTHHLTGGEWSAAMRGFLESGTGVLPWMALLFLPICFGLPYIFPWARIGHGGEFLGAKAAYLNVPFFLVRAGLYFAIWCAIARFLPGSVPLLPGPDPNRNLDATQARRRAARLSAPGLILFGITVHFAAYDWSMSLEPEWQSTMYGFLVIASQAPGVMAMLILSAAWVGRRDVLSALASPSKLYDVGNLLLAFILIWIYISFMQFLIIWSGNLPEEISWYLHRFEGGWKWLAAFLFLAQFAVPFLLLLFRSFKSNPKALVRLAAGLLMVHVAHMYWLVVPAFRSPGWAAHWQDAAALAAVGGAWAWIYGGRLARFRMDDRAIGRNA